ncbi:MAG: hypothetical protein WEC75_08015 [Dehalococcoidia bacterium]
MPSTHAAPAHIGLTVALWGFKDGDRYKAVCPEFSLIVRRETLDDAMRDLSALVTDYVLDGVKDGTPASQLMRPVPRSERVRLYLLKLLPLILQRAVGELLRRESQPPRMELRQQAV